MIDVTIEGVPAKAMLDSGANLNAISQDFIDAHASHLKKSRTKVTVKGVSGREEFPIYKDVNVTMFGQDLELPEVAALGLGIDLIIGSGFFQGIIVQIDYPNNKIQLAPKSSIDLKKHANVKMRQERGSEMPAVEVELNGKKTWLMLDTGNAGNLFLKRNFVIENDLLKSDTIETRVSGSVEVINTESFIIETLKIGPYELEGVPATIPEDGVATNLADSRGETKDFSRLRAKGVATKGILGYDVLKHFIVTIDYEDFRAHLWAQ
ncbi:aspartyl protease family protein [Thalassotalea litorea]|nr:aspartyl protease family protein [Thalassotalea litorea]